MAKKKKKEVKKEEKKKEQRFIAFRNVARREAGGWKKVDVKPDKRGRIAGMKAEGIDVVLMEK